MQTQPSAQGIASLYMGNPGALQQRVQKEQQAKPGLPPDLKQLMALNIVTNEQDAAKRQQAMQALNQMATTGGEPPTVAESLQQRAKEAIQARTLQEQRKQQGLQALAQQAPAQGIPDNTPQPEAQPEAQGIDELPVDMEFASGGIVAFAGGDSISNKFDQEAADKLKMLNGLLEQVNSMLTAAARSGDPQAIQTYASQAASVRDQINKVREGAGNRIDVVEGLAGLTQPPAPPAPAPAVPTMPAGRFNRMPGAREVGLPAGLPVSAPAPSRALATSLMPDVGEAGLAAVTTAPTSAPARPEMAGRSAGRGGPTRDELEAYERSQRRAADPRSAATPPAAPPAVSDTYPDETMRGAATTPANAPMGLDALHERNLRRQMSLDSEARAEELRKRYEDTVGRPDTAQYDRLITELENRKKQFDAPKAGFGGFAEYMKMIAQQGPRRTWSEAGTAGSMALDELNKQRRAQQFDLTKQGIDVAQKKLDLERAYKKDLFTLTEAERDQIDKQVQEATKEYGLSKRQAEEFKRNLELKAVEHKNRLAEIGLQGRQQAANRPFDLQGELAKAILAGNTARAEKLAKAQSMMSGAKRPGLDMDLLSKFEKLPGIKGDIDNLRALRAAPNPTPNTLKQIADIEARLLSRARAVGIDPSQIGLGSSASSVESAGAPPPGAVREIKR